MEAGHKPGSLFGCLWLEGQYLPSPGRLQVINTADGFLFIELFHSAQKEGSALPKEELALEGNG